MFTLINWIEKDVWGKGLLSQRICWEQNKGGKNVENKAISRSWGLFISTRSPSRLGNNHCSPRRSTLLTANLLKSIYGITHLTCADCLGQPAAMIFQWQTYTSRHWFFSQHCNPARVSCNWKTAPSANEMKQEQKVAIFCFEAAFERSARITNETTQWYVLSASSVEGSPPSCWKSKSSPASLHLPNRQHWEALLSLVTAILLV